MIGYLALPLVIFLAGWMAIWAAIVLIACVAFALRRLFAPGPLTVDATPAATPLQISVAILVGIAWTVLGGIGHLVFTNSDWHIRDAVLHDLVASPWPVGYGTLDARPSILRAPLGFYLPAALLGKWTSLHVAHFAMSVWTATGASLFLLQVLTLLPSRKTTITLATLVMVFFSGLDIIGNLLNEPLFRQHWNIAQHIEWWAGLYQYSSMTTQLFWVPNHAIGGWLIIGLLARARQGTALDSLLPMTVVAVALWSPFAACGVMPFVAWKMIASAAREHSAELIHPKVWAPAVLVGIAVAAYLGLDASRVPHSWQIGHSSSVLMDLLEQTQFVLLEAGIIGVAVLAIERSNQVILALVILALLPLVNLGPGNDFVMRASIPSLAVLAIGACLALSRKASSARQRYWQWALGCVLLIGSLTAIQEMARAILLPAWPINLQATLIGAACGKYPAHYVAHLNDEPVIRLLRSPHALPLGNPGRESCDNPALFILYRRGIQRP